MKIKKHFYFMYHSLNEARKNLRSVRGGPFGACIVRKGKVVAVARNTVLAQDATCHAEVNAIRVASRRLGRYDLAGCEIYTTTEPCPMCFAAIHWANIRRIYYGTTIPEAARLGFHELSISNRTMKRLGASGVQITSGVLRRECRALLEQWSRIPGREVY